MLMVQQIGSRKRAMDGLMRMFCSADAMVTGRVAAEDLVKRATARAGDMRLKTLTGFRPRAARKSGSTMKNWMKLPPMTTAVYLPRAPTMTPAATCADSWAAKARMPRGRTQSRARIRVKRTSCAP